MPTSINASMVQSAAFGGRHALRAFATMPNMRVQVALLPQVSLVIDAARRALQDDFATSTNTIARSSAGAIPA